MHAGHCQATCAAVQGSWDHCPPALKRSGHQEYIPAGQGISRTSPGQLCPSVDAEALEWWAGGLLMRQFQLGLQMASYLLGLASWCSSMVHRNLPASPGETNSVWKKLEMDLPRWSKTLMLKTKRHFQAKGSMSSQTQGACKHKSCKSSRLMMDASGTAPHKYPPCPPR